MLFSSPSLVELPEYWAGQEAARQFLRKGNDFQAAILAQAKMTASPHAAGFQKYVMRRMEREEKAANKRLLPA